MPHDPYHDDPPESEYIPDFFAHLTADARERTLKFLDAVDKYLEGHPPTGSVESLIQEALESLNELPAESRRETQKFLEALDERLGSPRNLNS